MSTRSTIGMLGQSFSPNAPKFDPSRPVTSIYCHSDGYIEHNGVLLDIFYRDSKTVAKLVSMGDMSALGYVIGVKHDFNRRGTDTEYYEQVRYMSCFYHRDRDGLNGQKYPLENYKGTLGEMPMESYCYIYAPEEQQWYLLENNQWVNLHKRIFNVIPTIEDIVQPLSHSINPKDTEAINKINAYGRTFKQYRAKHPYVPCYYKLKDTNDTREYYCKMGFGGNTQYKVCRIDRIEKNTEGKVVFFEMVGSEKGKLTSVKLQRFLDDYFADNGIILKNPSKFTAHLPK